MSESSRCTFCLDYPRVKVAPVGKVFPCPMCQKDILLTLSGERFRVNRRKRSAKKERADKLSRRRRTLAFVAGAIAAIVVAGPGLWNLVRPLSSTELRLARLENTPEVTLVRAGELPPGETKPADFFFRLSQAKHLERTDGFIHFLKEQRPDLGGLPFQMSPDCTLPPEKAQSLLVASAAVRTTLGNLRQNSVRTLQPDAETPALQERWSNQFWTQWQRAFTLVTPKDFSNETADPVTDAKRLSIPAVLQILEPESSGFRLGLVNNLKDFPDAEVGRALARRAIFDVDSQVRQAALAALADRPAEDYAPTLLNGLRYPMIEMAQNAATAIVFLKAQHLIPKLLDLMERPDPNAPFTETKYGIATTVIREVVRLNHHTSCLVCHPPSTSTSDLVRGLIPDPSKSLAPPPMPDSPSSYYGGGPVQPVGQFVHADTTYLRQDFSLLLPVENAAPWPKMQRFDFVVRTRPATDGDLESWQQQVARYPGGITPHQLAILDALRKLTGQDQGNSTANWRKALTSAH